MIERANLHESLTQFDQHLWVETWATIGGFIFVVTNFQTGARHVFTGTDEDSWKEIPSLTANL